MHAMIKVFIKDQFLKISSFLSIPWVLLLILSLIICLQRIHTYNEPTDRDIATYGVIAHEVISGKRIYEGILMDQKPPGIHFTYGIAELIVGYGRQEFFLLGVVTALATLFGVFFLGSLISNTAANWTAVYWTVICSSLPLEANQPNSEVFINAWIIFGVAFLLSQARTISENHWRAVAAGVCFAFASLYKHIVVFIPILVTITYLFFPISSRNKKKRFIDLCLIGLVGLICWVAFFIYFGITGRLSGTIESLFKYNRYYSGSIVENIFSCASLFSPVLRGLTPLFILILLSGFIAFIHKQKNEVYFVASLGIGAAISIALPGRFYPHYYQLFFPFLLVGTAYSINWIDYPYLKKIYRSNIFLYFIFFILVFFHLPSFFLNYNEWSLRKYGTIFLITDKLAKELDSILLPNESFYQIGSQAQFYFDTQRRPLGPLSDDQIFSGPLSDKLFSEMMNKLLYEPPDLIILEKYSLPKISQESPFIAWLYSNYIPAPLVFNRDPFYLFVKKDSKLQQRLENKYQ